MNLRILSPAHREIAEATTYLEKQAGLGSDLIEGVYSTFTIIQADPSAFPLWELNPLNTEIRRAFLKRFRYIIYYQVVPEEIIILTVRHASQDFASWMNRVQRFDT